MNKQTRMACSNTLNFYGSLGLQLCLSRSNIEVNKLRYFVFNWTMNVTRDWLDSPRPVTSYTSLSLLSSTLSQPTPRHDRHWDFTASSNVRKLVFWSLTHKWWNWNFHRTRKPILAGLSGRKMLKLFNCFLLSSAYPCTHFNTVILWLKN